MSSTLLRTESSSFPTDFHLAGFPSCSPSSFLFLCPPSVESKGVTNHKNNDQKMNERQIRHSSYSVSIIHTQLIGSKRKNDNQMYMYLHVVNTFFSLKNVFQSKAILMEIWVLHRRSGTNSPKHIPSYQDIYQ